MASGLSKVARLALQRAGRRSRLYNKFGVLLHHAIQVSHRVVNLMDPFHLLAGSNGYFTHNA